MDEGVNGRVVEGQLCSGSSFRTLWLLSRLIPHSVPISPVSSSLDKYPTFLSRVSVIPYLRYSCTGFSGSNRDFIGAVTFGIQDPGSTTVASPHNVRGEQFSCSTDFITNYLISIWMEASQFRFSIIHFLQQIYSYTRYRCSFSSK